MQTHLFYVQRGNIGLQRWLFDCYRFKTGRWGMIIFRLLGVTFMARTDLPVE
jgi:hypothetical protein